VRCRLARWDNGYRSIAELHAESAQAVTDRSQPRGGLIEARSENTHGATGYLTSLPQTSAPAYGGRRPVAAIDHGQEQGFFASLSWASDSAGARP